MKMEADNTQIEKPIIEIEITASIIISPFFFLVGVSGNAPESIA